MKYFPIYIDILGYEERAKDDAKKTGRDVKDIRRSYIDSVERRLDELKKNGVVALYNKSSDLGYSDEWLAFSENIWNAFKIVGEVLKAKLPIAVAIGVIEGDERYLIERSDEAISFLKTHLITKYIKFYKDKTNGSSPKQTYILLTPEAYELLESKNICSKPDSLAEFWSVDQEKFEGKLKVLEFLNKIGSQRAEYREIEDLYVAPQNYSKIKAILKEFNIVFIIGDAEMGKTYTAIRLLWEYFEEGYEPIYLPEERRKEQWGFIRHGVELNEKAVYLEDPWGRIEFETAESLFKEIGNLTPAIRGKRCKIIITSREEIFKEFEKRKEIKDDLWKYVAQLKVNLAYSRGELRDILKNYIDIFEPFWGKNQRLREIAFEAVGNTLRTPMSIKKLIDSSKDVKNLSGLWALIGEAAEETKITFAREIKEIFNKGEYDRLVFLSFAYIGVEPNVAKSCYEEVLIDLKYSLVKAKEFRDVFEESKEVEDVSFLRYVHPSYEDAFGFALTDAGKPNNICKNIFCRVLFKLSEQDIVAERVAICVADNFDKLPDGVKNKLLLELSEKEIAANSVALVIAHRFDQLSVDVREKLLLNLSEKSNNTWIVERIIANNFDKLSENLLLKP